MIASQMQCPINWEIVYGYQLANQLQSILKAIGELEPQQTKQAVYSGIKLYNSSMVGREKMSTRNRCLFARGIITKIPHIIGKDLRR